MPSPDPASGTTRAEAAQQEPTKATGNRGKIDDIESAQLTPDEVAALRALKKFDFEFTDYNLYDTIRDFGDGTLVLIETFRRTADGAVSAHDYQIMVKGGRGTVYNDYAQAMRLGTGKPSLVTRVSAPDVVLAALTVALVGAYLYATLTLKEGKTIPAELGLALTTVLGFWFGRQTKSPVDSPK